MRRRRRGGERPRVPPMSEDAILEKISPSSPS